MEDQPLGSSGWIGKHRSKTVPNAVTNLSRRSFVQPSVADGKVAIKPAIGAGNWGEGTAGCLGSAWRVIVTVRRAGGSFGGCRAGRCAGCFSGITPAAA